MNGRSLFGLGSALDPFEEMRRLQDEVNRLLASAGPAPAPGFPALNAYASEDGVVLTAELPGVEAGNLDVAVFQDTLTLRGRREPEAADANSYHRRERRHGQFTRTVTLPFRVDPDRVEAELQHGVLRLTLHRPEADRPRKIAVKA
jgi:HSP20 family protein